MRSSLSVRSAGARVAGPVVWLAGLVSSGCLDYGLNNQKENPGADSWDDPRDDTAVGPIPFPCEEEGQIALEVPIDEGCVSDIQVGTLDTVVEWSISAFEDYPEFSQILTVPVVGNLSDDNGDGVIGPGDVPDIVMVGDDNLPPLTQGAIHIISGDGDQLVRAIFDAAYGDYQVYPYRYASVALGDLDADGVPEIVGVGQLVGGAPPEDSDSAPGDSGIVVPDDSAGSDSAPDSGDTAQEVPVSIDLGEAPGGMDSPCRVVAWAPDGTVRWVAADAAIPCAGHVPAVADLDGDGAAEVIVGPIILEGADGAMRAWGQNGTGRYPAFDQVGFISAVADLDGDGEQEVVAGSTLYDSQGAVRCEVTGLDDGFPAVADLDGDLLGEVVLVGNGRMSVYNDDCTPVTSWDLDGIGNGGPPTIADFDADGVPEIGVATDTVYAVYEADGTMRWSQPVTDASSHTTGSSVFDFDGDGQAEVVYGDELALWIFDGADGTVRLQDGFHTSRTLHEYPVIADVDADGMAEIVVPQGGGHHGVANLGLYVLGSANNDWQYARPVWNQHAYNIVNINDDLTVPAHPDSNWPEHNNFRSGDINILSGGDTPDVIPQAVFCAEHCAEGRVGVLVRLGNGGMAEMRRDVPISVYSEISGQRYLLQTQTTTREVNPGRASEAVAFELNILDIPDGRLVVVGDDYGGYGGLAECREDNNELVLEGVVCE